ncbi:MAG: 30S ribosomal protein S13 [Candidatus Bilamarchaeaceae archaeon]
MAKVQKKKEKSGAKGAAKEAEVDESVHGAKKKEAGAEKAAKAAKKAAVAATEEGVRGIVRLAGKDVRGGLRLKRALTHVRGIGHSLCGPVADVVARELNVSPDVKVGSFSDDQIEKIDGILNSLPSHGIPSYMMNRRKDRETGKDIHVIMNELEFANRQDVEGEKKMYTWRGYRHAYGQKVRGQRTRNTGRTGMSLGVLRKTILAAATAAKAAEGGKGGAGAPAAAKAPAEKK